MGFGNQKTGRNEGDESSYGSLATDMERTTFSNFSTLPSFILDWIENNQGEIIIIWNSNGKILFTSKSIEQLLGYKRSELIGTNWYNKISSENINYIIKNLDTYENKQRFTLNFLHKNGNYMTADCVIEKIIDIHCNIPYYISSSKDVTSRKEAEEFLIHSEKMSVAGQLAAGIAHEIRNPLTSIKGFLQLLQAGVNRKEEYYNIMIDEIEKMEKITTELLFISKPLTDNRQLESIDTMIDDIVRLLNPQAKLKNIVIDVVKPIDENIYCDRSQIKQVLINIVKNAIEAMDEPGTINVSVQSKKTQVEICISDQGPGIPQEVIHKLGEPFFTTKKSGTGLGLMITKQILERHQGSLEILRNEDKGSTFIMILPKNYFEMD